MKSRVLLPGLLYCILLNLINYFLFFTKIKSYDIPKYKDPELRVLTMTSCSDNTVAAHEWHLWETAASTDRLTDLQRLLQCLVSVSGVGRGRGRGRGWVGGCLDLNDGARPDLRTDQNQQRYILKKQYIFYFQTSVISKTLSHVICKVNGKIYI